MTGPDPRQSPYLLIAATGHRGIGVAVTADATTAVVDVVLHDIWSQELRSQVSACLRMCMAGPTQAIIVDLQHVDDARGLSVPFWLAARRLAPAGPPPAHVVLCSSTTSALGWRLRNLRGPHPPVFATAQQARIAIAERMPRADRLQARLPAQQASVRAARDLVTQACRVWDLPHRLQDAILIVSELVTNAVQHAGTDMIVTVFRTGSAVHVAVHDGIGWFPYLKDPAFTSAEASLDKRGRGLRLVSTVAGAWGAMSARGGKVVWATVR